MFHSLKKRGEATNSRTPKTMWITGILTCLLTAIGIIIVYKGEDTIKGVLSFLLGGMLLVVIISTLGITNELLEKLLDLINKNNDK